MTSKKHHQQKQLQQLLLLLLLLLAVLSALLLSSAAALNIHKEILTDQQHYMTTMFPSTPDNEIKSRHENCKQAKQFTNFPL